MASTIDVATGKLVAAGTLPLPAAPYPVSGPAPSVRAAFPSAKALGPVLVVWSDHTLSLSRGGQIAWSREEALASVTSTLFIDLPAAKGSAGGDGDADTNGKAAKRGAVKEGGGTAAGSEDRLKQWVRMQALAVLVQFKLASDTDRAEFLRLREALKCAGFGGVACRAWGGAWRPETPAPCQR
jgi:hypothetical protein